MIAMTELNRKPLRERQEECDRVLKKQVPPEVYSIIREMMGDDLFKFTVLAAALKREHWDLFWGVFRDTVEERSEQLLSKIERPTNERGIFD